MQIRLALIYVLTALMISPASLAQVPVINIPEKAGIDPDFFKKYDPQTPLLRPESVPSLQFTITRAKELLAQASAEIKKLEVEIRKNEETIQKSEKLISLAREKMAKANQHYLQTEDAVQTLEKIDKTIKIQDLINVSTNSINLWCQEIKNGDAEILNLLKDPEIRNLSGDLAASFIQYVGEYEEMIRGTDKILGPMLRRLNLAINGFSLLRDVSYAGLHLKLSLERLI